MPCIFHAVHLCHHILQLQYTSDVVYFSWHQTYLVMYLKCGNQTMLVSVTVSEMETASWVPFWLVDPFCVSKVFNHFWEIMSSFYCYRTLICFCYVRMKWQPVLFHHITKLLGNFLDWCKKSFVNLHQTLVGLLLNRLAYHQMFIDNFL